MFYGKVGMGPAATIVAEARDAIRATTATTMSLIEFFFIFSTSFFSYFGELEACDQC